MSGEKIAISICFFVLSACTYSLVSLPEPEKPKPEAVVIQGKKPEVKTLPAYCGSLQMPPAIDQENFDGRLVIKNRHFNQDKTNDDGMWLFDYYIKTRKQIKVLMDECQ